MTTSRSTPSKPVTYSPINQPNSAIPHQHNSISRSTNTELLNYVQTQTIDINRPYLMTADSQTAGRGQQSRQWQSPKGNVYLSLYHQLDLPLSGILSLMIGYYLTQLPLLQKINRQRAQQQLPTVGVKWPNDIGYYDDLTFHKLAGILIEPAFNGHCMVGVVIGVGLNVIHAPNINSSDQHTTASQETSTEEKRLHQTSVSLQQLQLASVNSALVQSAPVQSVSLHPNLPQPTLNVPNASDLYLPIQSAVLRGVQHYIDSKRPSAALETNARFIEDYASVNVLTHQPVQVTQKVSVAHGTTKLNTLTGRVTGINPDGSLLLQTEDAKVQSIYTGRIERY